MTCIPVKNCGYVFASFQAVVSSNLLGAHIQHMGHSFIGFLTHAAFGVPIYSKYLYMAILSVQIITMTIIIIITMLLVCEI